MQLRETETLCVLDDHHGCVRHVNTDFDDSGGDENLYLARHEPAHHFLFFAGLHLAMQEANGEMRKDAVAQMLVHARRILQVHRSEEHTSELQSLTNLVCRLLLEKKKK